jgi:VWFA-related protein
MTLRLLKPIRRVRYAVAPVIVGCCMLVPDALAQAQPQKDEQGTQTYKVDINVVNILFNVKDKHGALVPGLNKDDFELYEDGKKQNIKYFAAESNLPLTIGMLIDSSGSQQQVLRMEQEVGTAFFQQVLREKDLAFLISFDVNVEQLRDFTNSVSDLRNGLEKVRINVGGGSSGIPGIGQGPVPVSRPRGTLLYDAIYLAADEKLKHEVGRKAMIILTDGQDQGSQETINAAIEAAQRSDSICYVILIADRGFYGGGYGGDREMKKLSEQTGGRLIEVGNRPEKLREAFTQIATELRSQYSIGYNPTNTVRDGTFRTIEIKTKGGKVQARKGYYAPKD